MKRKLLIGLGTLSMMLSVFHANSNSGGAISGHSGSPQSGNANCNSCHSGPAATTQAIAISTNIPPQGFSPNTVYDITVTANSNGATFGKAGFQSSVEGNGSHQGTLSVSGNELQIVGSNFVTHTSNGGTVSGGTKSWTFQWNSGNAPDGTTIYTSVNFANGNFSTNGDVILNQTLVLNQAPAVTNNPALIITGIWDGPLSGGTPKAIEIYVADTVTDLSRYSVANANNGGPFTLTPFTLPAGSALPGTYLYLASEVPGFQAYFGFAPNYTSSVLNVNGNDVVGLFFDGVLYDHYGEPLVNGTGTAWEYLDGWAYRVNGTGPSTPFVSSEWVYSGIDALDNTTTNATATNPVPIGTYVPASGLVPSLEVTEIMPGSNLSGANGGDWFEISNTGVVTIDLNGWSWDDNSQTAGTHTFGAITLAPGERLIVADFPSSNKAAWLTEWQLPATGLKIIANDEFNNIGFSGMGQSGDQVNIYDNNSQLKASSAFTSSVAGFSIYFNGGVSGGNSVSGVNSAWTSTSGDIGSPFNMPPSVASGIPTYDIVDVKGVDSDGVLDSLGVYCRVYGTVFSINFRTTGYSLWIKDHTDGINVFSFNNVGTYTPTVGDSIKLVGNLGQFNGLAQFEPDTIVFISANNPLGTPLNVSGPITEFHESKYIRINNVTLVNAAQWPTTGQSANVDVTNGTDTYLIRVNSATNIDGSPAPTGVFDVIGAGGQFDNSSPFTSGYQIQPSSLNDIIVNVPTTPTVNFSTPSMSALESAGSIVVTLPISPVSTSAGSITLGFTPGPGFTPQDAITIPLLDTINGTLTLPFSAGASSVSFTAVIFDDTFIESNETVTIDIVSATGGVNVGVLNQMVFTIIDNDTPIPTYNIADVRGIDAQGLPDSLGVNCKLEGIVYGFNIQSAQGTTSQFTLIDNTAGISVFYNLNNVAYSPIEGDRIRVIGKIDQFNGLTEILPDSIVLISSGNALNPPIVVNTPLNETHESDLIRINNVSLVNPSQWPAPGNNANIDITDGVNTYLMRIDRDTDVDDNVTAPAGTFDIIGLGAQFDNSAPYLDGYQIIPRYAQDVVLPAPPSLSITEIMPGSNLSNPLVNQDWWELKNTGSTAIDLTGFSWDDNSFTAGTVTFGSYVLQPNEAIVVWQGLAVDESLFEAEWLLTNQNVAIISSDEMTGSYPGLSQSGDGVAIFAPNGQEICRASYTAALPGTSLEFDNNCGLLGNAQVGVNNAYSSVNGDVGSPGNATIGLVENSLSAKVYPNPTKGILHIALETAEPALVKVRNIYGALISEWAVNNGHLEMNTLAWPTGVYVLEIEQGNKMNITKIVRQ